MNGSYPLLCNNPPYQHMLPGHTGRSQQGSTSELEIRDFPRPPVASPGCNGPLATAKCSGYANGRNVLASADVNLHINGMTNSIAPKLSIGGKNGYSTGLSSPDPRISRIDSGSCCLPTGCIRFGYDDSVFADRGKELGKDAMWLSCDNPLCQEQPWMHPECFREWQNRQNFKPPRRTRHFSDKDVLLGQNIMAWMKRDFDQDSKLNACRCGKGNLRNETTRASVDNFSSSLLGSLITPPPCSSQWDQRFTFTRDNNNLPMSSSSLCQQLINNNSCRLSSPSYGVSINHQQSSESVLQQILSNIHHQQQHQQQHQQISNFVAHASSSTPNVFRKQRGSSSSGSNSRSFDFFLDKGKAAAGNIFSRRSDMAAFDDLPRSTRNSYSVRVEDEGPYGNDETRCFLLTVLSSTGKTTVKCVVCRDDLVVYDKYPLINGTFFLSSGSYDDCGLDVTNHTRRPHHHNNNYNNNHHQQQQQFLNAVCMGCSNGSRSCMNCIKCGVQWRGRSLVIGTMYNFDVFAAMTCCSARLACLRCGVPVRDYPTKSTGIQSPVAPSFSDFCRCIACPRCHFDACHAIKSLALIFVINQPDN